MHPSLNSTVPSTELGAFPAPEGPTVIEGLARPHSIIFLRSEIRHKQHLGHWTYRLRRHFRGAKVQSHLPKHHLTQETKNLVNVSTAVLATVSALVLGLLIF